MRHTKLTVAALTAAFLLTIVLPWASAQQAEGDATTAPASVTLGEELALSVDPSWLPFILANGPGAFPVTVVDGAASLVLVGLDVCPADGSGSPPVGSCENGAFIVPLSGPLTTEQFAFIAGLGFMDSIPADLVPTEYETSGYRRECWYYDTNHYRCCDYYDSGMEYCYDYWYECHRNGMYNRNCGWSKHQASHKCNART
jgi:hypothetical protein